MLAHNISLINVQAGVALHLMDEQPEQARSALTAIKQASKDALGELRSVLGVLRQPDDDAPLDPAPTPRPPRRPRSTRPAPPASTCASTSRATPGRCRRRVDLAAFRIVQEALTNVDQARRPGARRRCSVRYGDDRLVVAVDDDGPRRGRAGAGAGADGTGSGLAGMRERAAALGGELVAGPRAGGGFHVAGHAARVRSRRTP